MQIQIFTLANGFQIEVAYRLYIVFTHAETGVNGDITLLNNGQLSAAIYNPKKIEEFKVEWSKVK